MLNSSKSSLWSKVYLERHLNRIASLLYHPFEENDNLVALLQEIPSAHTIKWTLTVNLVYLQHMNNQLVKTMFKLDVPLFCTFPKGIFVTNVVGQMKKISSISPSESVPTWVFLVN